MIEKLLDSCNELVMAGAQKTVDVWNWTTGSDKYTLAQTLGFASILPVVYFGMQEQRNQTSVRIIEIISSVYHGYSLSKNFRYSNNLKKLENVEENTRFIEEERIKQLSREMGYQTKIVGGVTTSLTSDLSFLGLNVNGLGLLVLACDNPKKRKNFLSRGLEYLESKIGTNELPQQPI